jgi:hypothetical protein
VLGDERLEDLLAALLQRRARADFHSMGE